MQSLTQKFGESFKEYAQKWRELAARVQPPMMEREMIDLFTNTLQDHYYVACSSSASFAEMVTVGERLESGLKSGNIQSVNTRASTSGGGKKLFGSYPKKKEGDANVVYGRRDQRK